MGEYKVVMVKDRVSHWFSMGADGAKRATETGYRGMHFDGFKIVPVKEQGKCFTHNGIACWVRKISKNSFTVIEENSGWGVANGQNEKATVDYAIEMMDKHKKQLPAMLSRIKNGQEGIHNEPKDLILYGIIK